MFYSITLFCVLLCAVSGQDNRVALNITPADVIELKANANICGEKYGVDPLTVRKMLDWTLPSDQIHKQFLYCVCLATGYIDSDGHFSLEKMLKFDTINGTREEFKNNLEECNKITKDNPLDTTYEMGICLHKYHITTVKSLNS